jgi:hypothetical protein
MHRRSLRFVRDDQSAGADDLCLHCHGHYYFGEHVDKHDDPHCDQHIYAACFNHDHNCHESNNDYGDIDHDRASINYDDYSDGSNYDCHPNIDIHNDTASIYDDCDKYADDHDNADRHADVHKYNDHDKHGATPERHSGIGESEWAAHHGVLDRPSR